MAAGRGGRKSKGPRHPTMVRLPVDHYERYAREAEALGVPVGDFIAYRMALHEGLTIPIEVLIANPELLALLPDPQRRQTLVDSPELAARYRTRVSADPLPFDVLREDSDAGRPAA